MGKVHFLFAWLVVELVRRLVDRTGFLSSESGDVARDIQVAVGLIKLAILELLELLGILAAGLIAWPQEHFENVAVHNRLQAL